MCVAYLWVAFSISFRGWVAAQVSAVWSSLWEHQHRSLVEETGANDFYFFFICCCCCNCCCIENSKHAKCAAKAEKINGENVNYTISEPEPLLSGRSTATYNKCIWWMQMCGPAFSKPPITVTDIAIYLPISSPYLAWLISIGLWLMVRGLENQKPCLAGHAKKYKSIEIIFVLSNSVKET